MKQLILGTFIGRVALSIRDKVEILYTLAFKQVQLPTLLNDKLASYLMTRICLNNKAFLDIGSHIGSVIAEVHQTSPTVTIIAFEAMPEKVLKLRKRFPFAEIHCYALGEDSGNVIFHINKRLSGYSSLLKPDTATQGDYVSITVEMKRLDDIVTCNDIDVIKIDVEETVH